MKTRSRLRRDHSLLRPNIFPVFGTAFGSLASDRHRWRVLLKCSVPIARNGSRCGYSHRGRASEMPRQPIVAGRDGDDRCLMSNAAVRGFGFSFTSARPEAQLRGGASVEIERQWKITGSAQQVPETAQIRAEAKGCEGVQRIHQRKRRSTSMADRRRLSVGHEGF